MSTSPPDRQFVQAIKANLAYWQQFVAQYFDQHHVIAAFPNIQQAIIYGLVLPETQRPTVQLTLQVYPMIERSGQWLPWLPLLEKAAQISQTIDEELYGKLLNCYGQLLRLLGRLEGAVEIHQTAVERAQTRNDAQALLEAQFNLSETFRLQQQYEQALDAALKALEIARGSALTEKWQASVLNTIGLLKMDEGNLERAAAYLQEAADLWRTQDNPTERARTLGNLANVRLNQKMFDDAQRLYEEALHYLAPTASELQKSRLYLSLGSLFFQQDDYDAAEEAFRQADSIFLRQSGDIYLRAVQAQNLGNVLLKKADFMSAERQLRRSLGWWQSLENRLLEANTLGTLAEALEAQGEAGEAQLYFEQALALLATMENPLAQRLIKSFKAQLDEINRS